MNNSGIIIDWDAVCLALSFFVLVGGIIISRLHWEDRQVDHKQTEKNHR
jgi:hypothetical protein